MPQISLPNRTSIEVRGDDGSELGVDKFRVYLAFVEDLAGLEKREGLVSEFKTLLQASVSDQHFTGAFSVSKTLPCIVEGKLVRFILLGLGKREEFSSERARKAGAGLRQFLSSGKIARARLESLGDRLKLDEYASLVEGFVLSGYRFDKYKSAPKDKDLPTPSSIELVCVVNGEANSRGLKERLEGDVRATAEAIATCCDWSNEPPNHGTPEYYAGEIQRVAEGAGIQCRILGPKEIREERMELLLGVSQGTSRECRLVVLEYVPRDVPSPKTLAWVGKGVTFDSGGISLKRSGEMLDMKHDMSGAATVVAAMLLAARRKVSNRIVAVLPFAENMPGSRAIVPGTVLKARSGQTVEIVNTDCEGRLLLADAIDYSLGFNPEVIIDVATLTSVQALGNHFAVVLGNQQEVVDRVMSCGRVFGELSWQLPLHEDYAGSVRSTIADLRNATGEGDGQAGAIRAALFLKQFVKSGIPWVHVDLSSVAYHMKHVSYLPSVGASGYWVRALAEFASVYGKA